MSLFNILGNITSATVKIGISPLAVVSDVLNKVVGDDSNNAEELIKSAGKDIEEIIDEVSGEKH